MLKYSIKYENMAISFGIQLIRTHLLAFQKDSK